MTPDPYRASAKLINPTSWNRYAYVNGDPVNSNDPSGLDGDYCSGGDMWSDVNGGWDCVVDTDQEENTSYVSYTNNDVTGTYCTDATGNAVQCGTAGAIPTAIGPGDNGQTPSNNTNATYNPLDGWAINLGLFLPPWFTDYPVRGGGGLPTPCSGGAFVYVGGKLPIPGNISGFFLPIDYNTRTGFSTGGIVEVQIPRTPVSGGGEVSVPWKGGVHIGLIGFGSPTTAP
jgi:hypothetical protein